MKKHKLSEIRAMKKERCEKVDAIDKRLQGADQERVEKIILYIVSKNLDPYVETKIIIDVIDIISDGLDRGMSLEEILGDDDKAFVDDIAAEYKKSYKYLIGSAGGAAAIYMLGIMLFSLPAMIKTHNLRISIYGGELFLFLAFLMAGLFIVEYIVKTTYDDMAKSRFVLPVIALGAAFCLAILTWNQLFFTIHVAVAVIIVLAGYLIFDLLS